MARKTFMTPFESRAVNLTLFSLACSTVISAQTYINNLFYTDK